MTDLYQGRDPRDIPTYTIPDAARYLRIPAGTVRSWTVGRSYPVTVGKRFFEPLITVSQQMPRLLSFTNLIEIHVLRAIRKHHKIQLDKVRTALDYLEEQLSVTHPLAHEEFRTDGISLFIERYGTLVNASSQGQTQLKAVLTQHLERIEPDDSGLISLYPLGRSPQSSHRRH